MIIIRQVGLSDYITNFVLFFRDVPLHVKVLNYEIVTVGIIAGVASSYSAIEDLISSQFTVPCYVNPALVANKTG